MIAIRSWRRFGFALGFLFLLMPVAVSQPAPAPAPAPVAAPAQWNRLFAEAEMAFAANNFGLAIQKIQALLALPGDNNIAPVELLCFNIGLANLLRETYPEAEAAFEECIKRFPNGEYISRCYLGLGRARMLQDSPEKKQLAIEALKTAAKDPKYRFEAEMWLGQVLIDLKKPDEALALFRSLTGSDVSTPQQTTAAVEVIGLLADLGNLKDLSTYLGNLARQSGVRDALAWFANQAIVCGDELVGKLAYEPALAIYRSVPQRSQILETQANALEGMRKDMKVLELKLKLEQGKPLNHQPGGPQPLNILKPAVEQAETALRSIEERADLDAALLMRRGRCLYYLDRHEEALICFRTIRTKYPTATDAEKAAYAEIVILNKRKASNEIKDKCDQFLLTYPQSENAEQVAILAGEVLVQSGDWKAVGAFYRELEEKFPRSDNMDRFVFFQGLAFFQDADFAESTPLFERFLKTFPNSALAENAYYYVAMAYFLSNQHQETLAATARYLEKFPKGRFAGDIRHRLAFIELNDKNADHSDKTIRDLSRFLAEHPDDPANGSMLCLLADTYKKKADTDKEPKANEDKALESYTKAVWTDSPDDVIQYGLDSATNILKARKDWGALAELRAEFLKRKPDSQIALPLAIEAAKAKKREGKGEEAADVLAVVFRPDIANPAKEEVESLLDELVKSLVPRKNEEIDADALDKQLVEILDKIIAGQENATTTARLYYARARLAQILKRNDRSDLYLKGIATNNAKDPAALSPRLLEVCGDILLKTGDLDGAETMYKRLRDRFPEAANHDAGAVGLGYVELARKKPEAALKIFDNALATIPGMLRFKEAMLGKLEALVELDQLEPGEKLAEEIIGGGKEFRGETAGKASLLLARIYREQAAKAEGEKARALLKKAHGLYIRVFITYKGFPDISAESIWEASEVAGELGDEELRKKNLQDLLGEPKLQGNEFFKKAAKEAE